MPREPVDYRANLEDILRYTDNRRLLNMTEVADYLGRSTRWVKTHLGVTKEGISAMTLARKLSGGD